MDRFGDDETSAIYEQRSTKGSRQRLPTTLHRSAARKIMILLRAELLRHLRDPPGNRLEALTGDLAGYHSIRINEQFRIVFRWTDDGPVEIRVVDYH